MRRSLWGILAFFALISCSKIPDITVGAGFGAGTTFHFTAPFPEDGGDRFRSGWQPGDVVLIFLKDVTTGYLRMEYDGESWSTQPRGAIELKDMLSNGRKTVGAVALLNGENVTASYSDGVWAFSPAHPFRYFTAGPSAYKFSQDGSANYSFSGEIELTAVPLPDNTTLIYLEKPSGDEGFLPPLTCDSFMPLQGLAGFGSDGKVRMSSKPAAGSPIYCRPCKVSDYDYLVYEAINADPIGSVEEFLPNDFDFNNREYKNGYGYLFELDYGKHSMAMFQFIESPYASASSIYLPEPPARDWSMKRDGVVMGWCPFRAAGKDLDYNATVPVYGTRWATCNYMTDKPWELGSTINHEKIDDYIKQYSSSDIDYPGYMTYQRISDLKHVRYHFKIHGTDGILFVDYNVPGYPFVFFPSPSGSTKYFLGSWSILDPFTIEHWTYDISKNSKSPKNDGDIYLRVFWKE